MSLRFVTTRPGRPTGNQARDQRCQAAPAGTRAAGAEPEHLDGIGLVAMLNDLLQLEHDALPAYQIAIAGLRNPAQRDRLLAFRDDHRRHVDELTALIQAHGGVPLRLPHLPTGIFKLLVQMAGLPGGDRAILLAFKANEWQSQEKYGRRAAEDTGHAPELAAFLRRAAEDEARHYAWVCDALEGMGVGRGTLLGAANSAFARFHGTLADGIEGAGRLALEAMARVTRPG
jgi:rubrerythrin